MPAIGDNASQNAGNGYGTKPVGTPKQLAVESIGAGKVIQNTARDNTGASVGVIDAPSQSSSHDVGRGNNPYTDRAKLISKPIDLSSTPGMLIAGTVGAALGATEAGLVVEGGSDLLGAIEGGSATAEIGGGSSAAGELASGSRAAGELTSGGGRAELTAGERAGNVPGTDVVRYEKPAGTDLARIEKAKPGDAVVENADGSTEIVAKDTFEKGVTHYSANGERVWYASEPAGSAGSVESGGAARALGSGGSGEAGAAARGLGLKGKIILGVVAGSAAVAAGAALSSGGSGSASAHSIHITPHSAGAVYKTMAGDTVASIAAANGLTVSQLELLNPTLNGKQAVPKGTEVVVNMTNLPHNLTTGEYTALANQATNDKKLAEKHKEAAASDQHELNKLHSEYGAARAAGDKEEMHKLGLESISEERKLKNDLSGQKASETDAQHLQGSLSGSTFGGSTDLSAHDLSSLKAQQKVDLGTAADDKAQIKALQADITKLQAQLKFAQAGGNQSLASEITNKINHDENLIKTDQKEVNHADSQAYHLGTLADRSSGSATSSGSAPGQHEAVVNPDKNAIDFTAKSDKTTIGDILKKYDLTRGQFDAKNPDLAGKSNDYTISMNDTYRVPTVNVDKTQLSEGVVGGGLHLDSNGSIMPVSASTGSNQPGLGMAPGTTLSDYPGAHVNTSSGALVHNDKLSSEQSVSEILGRFNENWPEFQADNPELAKEYGQNGKIPAGKNITIRADKYVTHSSSGGLVTNPGGPMAPSNSSGASDHKTATDKKPDAAAPTPTSSGHEPVSTHSNTKAKNHTQEGSLSLSEEHKQLGTSTGTKSEKNKFTGASSDFTHPVEYNNPDKPLAASVPAAPTPTSVNHAAPSPGTTITPFLSNSSLTAPAAYPGQHVDSTSGVQVVPEVAGKSMSVEDVYKASGETWDQFYNDNKEFKQTGHIDKGRNFEIRASNAPQYNAAANSIPVYGPHDSTVGTLSQTFSATPAAPVAAASPNGGVPLPPTPAAAPAPSAPDPTTPTPASNGPTAAQVAIFETQGSLAPASDGQPALGMAPGSSLGYGTGAGSGAHKDSTSGALVYTETAPKDETVTEAIASNGWGAGGENSPEFLKDNTEFGGSSVIPKGHYFEIRADHAFPGASTYNIK